MALSVTSNLTLATDCTSIYFFDKTGAYNVTSNPTGYGAPNYAIGDFTVATLSVLTAGATTPTVINAYSSLPSSNVNAAYEITLAALGLTELPSGLTRVTYRVAGSAGTPAVAFAYTTTKLFLVDCEYRCCIDKKRRDLAQDPADCSCTDKRVSDLLYAEAMLEAAQAATCCGDAASATAAIAILETLCSDCGCGC